MAFSFAQVGDWGVWSHVGTYVEQFKELGTVGFAAAKGAIHGVVGGAISVAQGGNFQEGFAANAIGAAAGVFSQGVFGKAGTGGMAGKLARTASAAVAGGAAAIAAGGKFANGALTAAFAHLYNQELTAARSAAATGGRLTAAGIRAAGAAVGIGLALGDGPFILGDISGLAAYGLSHLAANFVRDPLYTIRVQAQGGGLEASVTVSGTSSITVKDASLALYQLARDIGPVESGVRSRDFIRVSQFFQAAAAGGGVPAGTAFPPFGGRSSIRVDFNNLRGHNIISGNRSGAAIGPTIFD